MNYMTTYFHNQEKESSSIVIFQFEYRGVPVCFSCLFDVEKRGAFMHKIREWCDSFPWTKATCFPKRYIRRAEKELCNLRLVWEKEAKRKRESMLFFLGIESEILLLGDCANVWFVNTYYGKGHAQQALLPFRGRIEEGVGILLAQREEIGDINLKISDIETVLRVNEITKEEQMARRLKTLIQNRGTAFFLLATG